MAGDRLIYNNEITFISLLLGESVMRGVACIFLSLMMFATAKAEQICGAHRSANNTSVTLMISGAQSDLIKIFYNDRLVLGDYTEMRKSMGVTGNSNARPLTCSDVDIVGGIIAVTAGWQRDILHAYALISKNGEVVGVQRAIVRFRDGKDIIALTDGSDVTVKFGREHDLMTRLCYGNRPGASDPPYAATEWGWFHGTPRTGNFPPCQGRLNTGGNGSANWGQTFFPAGTEG